ncbi:MAG: Hsp70 family protein [Micrococcales bacterium]|nr:Hsp70 family protein [Micrococcales bacterium]MCL2667202.1 Hsp70 family protein [Micrococcales bacterium]
MGWALTIDFGTVNTAAAWRRDGQVEKVVLEPGSDTMPSAVVRTGSLWRVGQAAVNARRGNPDTFVASPKAHLGQEPVVLGDETVTPAELVSHVLKAARERAVRSVDGTEPDQLVLTHPEHWEPTRLAALHEAARLAGFRDEQVLTLPEPVAAVHGHTVPASLPAGSRMAVVDVGGGTCDVAVVETTHDAVVVVAREGDEQLGGNDLDALLYRWVTDQLSQAGRDDILEALDEPKNLAMVLTLMDIINGAKHDLSDHVDAPIAVSAGPGREVALTITRTEYEEVIAEPVGRVAALVTSALRSSGTEKITHLFLAGGTAYTPVLARALEPVTGILATSYGNPKLVTALGALRATDTRAVPPATVAPPPVAPPPADAPLEALPQEGFPQEGFGQEGFRQEAPFQVSPPPPDLPPQPPSPPAQEQTEPQVAPAGAPLAYGYQLVPAGAVAVVDGQYVVAGQYGMYPAPPPKRRSPVVAVAVVLIVVVLVATGLFALRGRLSGNDGAGVVATGSEDVRTSPDTDVDQVRRLVDVLTESSSARASLGPAVTAVRECNDVSAQILVISSVADNRRELLATLDAVLVDQIPGGTALLLELQDALRAALGSDEAYLEWAREMVSTGCAVGTTSTHWADGQYYDELSGTTKRTFVNNWNTNIAPRYDVPTFTRDQI